jgi:hypothetical protein
MVPLKKEKEGRSTSTGTAAAPRKQRKKIRKGELTTPTPPTTPTRKGNRLTALHTDPPSIAMTKGRDGDEDRGQNHEEQKTIFSARQKRTCLALSQSTGTALEQKLEECSRGLEGFMEVLGFIDETYKEQLNTAKKNIAGLLILIQNSRADSAVR